MSIEELSVLEYSKNQNQFHITTLADSLAKNKKTFMAEKSNDYQIIAIETDEGLEGLLKLQELLARTKENK